MLTAMLSILPADINCTDVAQRINNREPYTQNELSLCKKEVREIIWGDYRDQLAKMKDSRNYCELKWNSEINYRRAPTRVEEALCGKTFQELFDEELAYKKTAQGELMEARRTGNVERAFRPQ